ncbi:hypothetical protein D3C80_2041340 [compost metagenome]
MWVVMALLVVPLVVLVVGTLMDLLLLLFVCFLFLVVFGGDCVFCCRAGLVRGFS